MDYALSEEQEILKKFARDFLTEKFNKKSISALEAGNGHSPEIWNEMSLLGWQGLAFPDTFGGAGMSFLDLGVLLEEMGKAGAVSPYFSAILLGGIPIYYFGNEEQKAELLPRISSGELLISLASYEKESRLDAASMSTKATRKGNSYSISGTKLFVPYAQICQKLIVLAKTDEKAEIKDSFTLFIVDNAGSSIKVAAHSTRVDKMCQVVFQDVEIPQKNVLGEPNRGWPILMQIMDSAVIARCCQMLGLAQKAFDTTIDYIKQRKQYGRPVGTFQAMQHHAAELLTDIYGMRVGVYRAAWLHSKGKPCSREAAIAREYTLQASERIVSLTHQMHGAIGVTLDYDLRLYTMPLKAYQIELNNLDYFSTILSREIGL